MQTAEWTDALTRFFRLGLPLTPANNAVSSVEFNAGSTTDSGDIGCVNSLLCCCNRCHVPESINLAVDVACESLSSEQFRSSAAVTIVGLVTQNGRSKQMTTRKTKPPTKNNNNNSRYPSYKGLTPLIPERHFVRLRCSVYYAYGDGGITSNYTNYFVVDGASIYLPFTTGVNWSGSQNGSPSGVGGSAITSTFPGTAYLTGLYKSYRVQRSSLAVSVMPEIGGDACITSIYAYPGTSSASVPPLAMNAAATQLGARSRLCSVGVAQKFNRIQSSVNACDIVGMTQSEYNAQIPTLTGADASGLLTWSWAVQIATADGTASGSSGIPVRLDLVADVEFMNVQIPLT